MVNKGLTILVTGSRYYKDKDKIKYALEFMGCTKLIEGGQKGADRLAREAAQELGIEVVTVEAEWNKYGLAAGPIRNRKMLEMKPHLVYAFHEDLENSKGTKDCLKQAKEMGIPAYNLAITGVKS